MLPYTYHIFCTTTQQHYYGSRYSRNCSPNDLWTTYFTSSRVVKRLIEQYGPGAFEVEIRRTFQTREQAIDWEFRVLTRLNAANREDWINQHNGKGRVRSGFRDRKHTEESKRKIGQSKIGRKRPDLSERNRRQNPAVIGRVLSEETKRKIGLANKGKKRPDLAERNRKRAHSSP